MKKFRTLIRGENLYLSIDGSIKRMGVYKTIFLEAKNENEARGIAFSLIHENLKLKENILNDDIDPPEYTLEEIIEVENIDNTESGFVFYADPITSN